MSRPKELDSASAIVEAIFGETITAEAKAHYEERLRSNYLHKKNEDKIPGHYRWRSNYGERRRSHLTTEARHYFENLLLLDSIFLMPKKVFEVLGDEDKRTVEERVRYAKHMIRQRRAELAPIQAQRQAVLNQSASWENLPDDFDLYRDSLGSLLIQGGRVNSPKENGESWKFPLADKIRRIEESPEWQAGDLSKAAERAMCFHDLGNTELAHVQIDELLAENPMEPVLYYVKAVLLIEGAAYHWKQSFLHRQFGATGIPLTAEERWHDEQASDQAMDAMTKEQHALEQLLCCYQHWDENKFPNWARFGRRHDAELLLIQKIIAKACLHLDTTVYIDYSRENSVLTKIRAFIERVHSSSRFEHNFYNPAQFASLLGFWKLCRFLNSELHGASVKQWHVAVTDCFNETQEGIWRTRDWFEPPLDGHMKFEHPFTNRWPELIVRVCGNAEFMHALDIAKIPQDFLSLIDRAHASQTADGHLWSRIQLEWSRLVTESCDTPLKRIQVCRCALEHLLWTESDFGKRWRTHWEYAEVRCHFDAAMLLADQDKQLARDHLGIMEARLDQCPDIQKKAMTLFTLDQSYDDLDVERDSDLIGNDINIFMHEVEPATEAADGWSRAPKSETFDRLILNIPGADFMTPSEMVDRFDSVRQKLQDLKGSPFERLKAYLEG
ncbi:hypothetical protein [Cerasicoccus fimbriatus]|uniref:hypothetical protein n=1 Tax=Cerasicoccus fimbriatus TaxID=3014554 RepID=UPI0022B3E44B|nr:hypothetical protein [Cerasicoccus sp. TK19100]